MSTRKEEIKKEEQNKKTNESKTEKGLSLAEQKELMSLVKSQSEFIEGIKSGALLNQGNASSSVDIGDTIDKTLRAIREEDRKKAVMDTDSYVDYGDIDKDDILEEEDWVVFIAHKMLYVIVDTVKNGRNVKTPTGKPILFEYGATRKVKKGRETDLFAFSTYVCKSKTEKEWLENHHLFNITFFKNMTLAQDSDSRRAVKLAKIMNQMNGYGQADLVKLCKEHRLQVGSSLSEMRISLASKMADDQIAKEINASKVRLQQTQAAEMFLKGNETSFSK